MSDKTFKYSLPYGTGMSLERLARLRGTDPNEFLAELVDRYLARVQELRGEVQKGVDAMVEGRYTRVENKEQAEELKNRIIARSRDKLADKPV